MLNLFLLLIAGSAIVLGMSINTFFTTVYYSINCYSVDITEELLGLMALLELQTGVPADGYYFTNLRELTNIIGEAHYLFELGYVNINGMLVYAIKIGNAIYSVEPRIFHSLIFMLF